MHSHNTIYVEYKPPVSKPLFFKEGRKENVLFNDALNTFYLRLYGIVKDHSDSERGNLLLSHGLLSD